MTGGFDNFRTPTPTAPPLQLPKIEAGNPATLHPMARTRTTPTVDTLLDLAAKAPWWAGASLAAMSALALQGAAQIVLPMVGLSAALASVLARRKQAGTVVADDDVLDGMNRREFESLVAESFRRQGYQIAESAVEGTDITLRKDRQTWLVHCKPWRAAKVDADVVETFISDLKVRGAAGGFIMSSGRFTREAVAFASGKPVQLIAGPALQLLIKKLRSSRVAAPPPSPLPAPPAATPPKSTATTAPLLSPTCPKCNSAMLKRKAKRGEHAGLLFWGCVMHPDCRGVRRISAASPPG